MSRTDALWIMGHLDELDAGLRDEDPCAVIRVRAILHRLIEQGDSYLLRVFLAGIRYVAETDAVPKSELSGD